VGFRRQDLLSASEDLIYARVAEISQLRDPTVGEPESGDTPHRGLASHLDLGQPRRRIGPRTRIAPLGIDQVGDGLGKGWAWRDDGKIPFP
jgi:hypothetical protein